MVWGRQTGGPGNQIEIPVETGNPPDLKLTATQSNEGIMELQIPVGIANQSHNLRVKALRLCGERGDGLLGHGRYQDGEHQALAGQIAGRREWCDSLCPHRFLHEGKELAQGFFRGFTQLAFAHVGLTAVVEVPRALAPEGLHDLPTPMRSIVVPIDGPIDGPALPVIAVAPGELQRIPDIHEAAIAQHNTQLIDVRSHSLYHDV